MINISTGWTATASRGFSEAHKPHPF